MILVDAFLAAVCRPIAVNTAVVWTVGECLILVNAVLAAVSCQCLILVDVFLAAAACCPVADAVARHLIVTV